MKGWGGICYPLWYIQKFYFKSTLNPILFLNANHEIAITILTLGGAIPKVYDFNHLQSELKSSYVAYVQQCPVAYLKRILCMQISKTPTSQR